MRIEAGGRWRAFSEQGRRDAAQCVARQDHGAVEGADAEGWGARRRLARRALNRSGSHYNGGSRCGVLLKMDMVHAIPRAATVSQGALGQHET
jgi:hypothetical protein